MSKRVMLSVPDKFYKNSYFHVEEKDLRIFLESIIAFISDMNEFIDDEIDVVQTIKMHSGDCRLWCKDCYYDFDASYVIIKCQDDDYFETIYDWMKKYTPDLYDKHILYDKGRIFKVDTSNLSKEKAEDLIEYYKESIGHKDFNCLPVIELNTEYPIVIEDIEYDIVQDIEIYDPRHIMSYEEKMNEDIMILGSNNKILIKRVVKKVPKNTKTLFYIKPTKVIDIIKVYSFEEWDEGLKAFDKKEGVY